MAGEIQERSMTGRIVTQEATGQSLYHQVVTVTAVAATDRTRADVSPGIFSITVQGADDNAGKVYIGDSAVTNAAGDKIGFALGAGVDFGPIQLSRAQELYVAADNANDQLVIIGVM